MRSLSQLLAHARQDATLSSARRALRFIGANGDLTFLADEVLSSLENRYPRPFRRGQRGRAVLEASMSVAHTGRSLLTRGGDDDAGSAGNGRGGLGESNYRRQCLTWIKPRLPMAWMLNQALMGRGPERCSEKTVRQEDRRRPDLAQASSGEGGVQPGVSRSLAIAWVSVCFREYNSRPPSLSLSLHVLCEDLDIFSDIEDMFSRQVFAL